MTKEAAWKILLFFAFLSLGFLNCEAQALTKRVPPNSVMINGKFEVLKSRELQLKLWWNTSTDNYQITAVANEDGVVFFAKRFSKKGIEAFARSLEVAEVMKQKGMPVKVSEKLDPHKPYIIRMKGEVYHIEPYTELSDLEKLFKVLDQLLAFRALPLVNKQPPKEMVYTPFEIGKALMFESPVDTFWKEK